MYMADSQCDRGMPAVDGLKRRRNRLQYHHTLSFMLRNKLI